ncbi:MAG: hypothetical protein HS111_12490 [Kofleriaceae bacterium]|nr:hypothetical protein [Kofleriaceae bacterium]MCL4224180.1 hypothetical protein [Myxococcales bacterium]
MRSIRGIAPALALASLTAAAACGKKTPPPPPPPPPVVVEPPPPPPPPVCVPASEPATIGPAAADAGSVRFCVNDGAGPDALTEATTQACFAVELASRRYERLDRPPPQQPRGLSAPAARLVSSPTEVRVCPDVPDGGGEAPAGDGAGAASPCRTLRPKVPKNAATPIAAALDAAGTTVVMLLGNAEAGKGVVEVWDVARARRTATIRYARGDYRCGAVQLLGDVIFVSASACAGPAGKGALYSLKGKKLADVGGKDFGTHGTVAVQVDATRWAFLEEGGGLLAVQDVATGKVEATIELVSLWNAPGSRGDDATALASGNPGESMLVRGGDGTLVVIAGSPAAGTVGVIDLAAGEVDVIGALPCPPAPDAGPGSEPPNEDGEETP